MKFNDYIYKRPEISEAKDVYATVTKILQDYENTNSPNIEKLINSIKDVFKYENTFYTMSNLCQIRYSINVLDTFYEKEMEYFNENIPYFIELSNKFKKELINSKAKELLIINFGKHYFDLIEISLKTFSPEIIDDLVVENKLVTNYSKLKASGVVDFRGEKLPISSMGKYTESLDRNTRKEATHAVAKFYEDNEIEFGNIFDELVKVRNKIAKKLGFKNFIELAYARLNRLDYDAKMVKNYRDEIFTEVVPFVNKIALEKINRLNINNPYSYDFNIDFISGNPKPVGDSKYLLNCAKIMYHEMSLETKEFFDFMLEKELFDLEAKKGKDSGGYCTYIPDYKSPFIFANFNGTQSDVDVLTHEAGHAFQAFCSKNYIVPEYLSPSYEACEIHSMSMEFFAWPWMKLFFNEDTQKYHYSHLVNSVDFIPYGALVDEFQHEIYDKPQLSINERKSLWRTLENKYLPHIKYDNNFLDSGGFWYRQLHIFTDPFYYIDYTLAQICAYQFWNKNNINHKEAWDDYLKLCKLGGSMSFLNLLSEANLKNPFVTGTIKDTLLPIKKWIDNFDISKIS